MRLRKIFVSLFLGCSLPMAAMSFDTVIVAKVISIDEWDTGFTKVTIDKTTSCGSNWFWVHRPMDGYNLYLTRVLTAMVADKQIRIVERAPAWCDGGDLYNPRIGIM